MAKAKKTIGLTFVELINPVFVSLKELGASGTVKEITEKVIQMLNLPDSVVDVLHDPQTSTRTELDYQLAWARTYLKKFGAITNSSYGVWSITPQFMDVENVDSKQVVSYMASTKNHQQKAPNNNEVKIEMNEQMLEETPMWKTQLAEVLHNMDPYGFERLAQRLLRECGFSQVKVTKKSGDGGIDGIGKLKINGIFSFNVAFQCKRYKGSVSASDIRDFRGSLATNIEKGIFITTGTFTKAAREEASEQGKQQIDLMDGEEFMNKLAEYEIGMREVKSYEIDEEFFSKI